MRKRSSGILMHISSLPSDYGIGDFGIEAYKFVDFLEKAKQKYWQILPLGITGFGDSPYQCISTFAGNPYFIDLNELISLGYIEEKDVESLKKQNNLNEIDYEFLYINKIKALRTAYRNIKKEIFEKLEIFYKENQDWIRDFSLFMSLKDENNGKSWIEWEEDYKNKESSRVIDFENKKQDEIYFWVFTQYLFFQQWQKLKRYANRKNVHIIGDLPIYVSMDSSDIWSNPSLFNLNEELAPITVAAVPPDAFSHRGQLWGNPIYNWNVMEEEAYSWWIKRIEFSFKLYDVLRIDHFIGFESYFEVEYGSEDAKKGKWEKGPGIKLFKKIEEKLGSLNIIAEDLGVVTEDVRRLIKETGYPGMKVLQFAFGSGAENEHLPHNHNKDMLVYTGTHDNPTIISWSETMKKEKLEHVKAYLNIQEKEELNWSLIRAAWSSPAYMAIAPIQDFLGLGDEGRMNTPSTVGDNWTFRINKDSLTKELEEKIACLTNLYGR